MPSSDSGARAALQGQALPVPGAEALVDKTPKPELMKYAAAVAGERIGTAAPGDSVAGSGVSGGVAVTLYRMSGSEPLRVTLGPEARVLDICWELRRALPDEFHEYVPHGSFVLLGKCPQSWGLHDAWVKFMLADSVQKTLLSGAALDFQLVARKQEQQEEGESEHLEIEDSWDGVSERSLGMASLAGSA